MGIGRKLVATALEAAKEAGASPVILVGDAPYYAPFGFTPMPEGRIRMPRPVDPARLLVAEIAGGSLAGFKGDLIPRGSGARGRGVNRALSAFPAPHRAESEEQRAKTEKAAEQRRPVDRFQDGVVRRAKSDPVAARCVARMTDGRDAGDGNA